MSCLTQERLRDGLVVAVQARNDPVVLQMLDVRHVQRDSACVKERPQVSVPMVVGMTVLAARRAAGDAEVVLAPANADGPPLGALLWPHESEYVIASQSPVAGTRVRQYDRVVITYVRTNTVGPGGGWGQGATSTQASTRKPWCCSSA